MIQGKGISLLSFFYAASAFSFFSFLLPPESPLILRCSLYSFLFYQKHCSSSQYTEKQQNKYCRLNPYPLINIFYFFCITGIACTFFYNWRIHTLPLPLSIFQIHALFGDLLRFYCLTTVNASLYPCSFTGTCGRFLLKPFVFLFMLQFGYLFFFAHLFTYGTIFFFAPPLRYRWLPFLFPSHPACVPGPLF